MSLSIFENDLLGADNARILIKAQTNVLPYGGTANDYANYADAFKKTLRASGWRVESLYLFPLVSGAMVEATILGSASDNLVAVARNFARALGVSRIFNAVASFARGGTVDARRKDKSSSSDDKPLKSVMTWDEIFQEYGYAIAAAGLIVILLLKQ